MPKTLFYHGTTLMVDYTPVADVEAGTIVKLGKFLCVTHRDIKAGQLGALSWPNADGVYKVPLKASDAYSIGDLVHVDVATGKTNGTTGTDVFGVCVQKAVDQSNGDEHVICVHQQDISAA